MMTISSRDYFARIPDKLPKEMLEILKSREYDHPTTLSKMDGSDFSEIYDEIYEKDYESSEDQCDEFTTFVDLVIARAEREDNLLEALKLYEYALHRTFQRQSSILGLESHVNFMSGVDLIWLRLKEADTLDISQKRELFNYFISDEDSWEFPVCSLLICVVWDLLPEDMDACIINYLRIRTGGLLGGIVDDPWSQNCTENYVQCMYLLVIAALNSTGSESVIKIIEKTSESGSVSAFWVILCLLACYTVDPDHTESAMGEYGLPGSDVWGWDWGSLLFDEQFQRISASGKAVDSLINLYQKNSNKWPWALTFFDNDWKKEDLDQFIQLWQEKINWARNQKNDN